MPETDLPAVAPDGDMLPIGAERHRGDRLERLHEARLPDVGARKIGILCLDLGKVGLTEHKL